MSDSTLLSIDVEVTTEDGGTETRAMQFKSLRTVPIGIIRRTRHNQEEQMWEIFEWALSVDDLATLDAAPAAKLLEILAEMQKVSQVELGESQASPTS
ncbi:MAG: hypothetical protein CK431_04325 [Mycobacterium sp.]|nr:MAG: hypothetical protein CK431_04325 [Mycobacterium sp.]